MSERPLVSVIVPVYNAESCIEECIASILAQTHGNLEVLVVDDGSVDGSSVVLRGIVARDDRVKLFIKENGGVSSARNLGLDNASGSFVAFVDADDTVEPNMIEALLSACIETGSDVACCDFRRGNRGRWSAHNQEVDAFSIMGRDDFLLGVITGSKGSHLIGGYLCNKLFSKSLLQRSRLETGRIICEDLLFVLEVGERVERACCVSAALYNYTVAVGSATHRLDTLVTSEGGWAYFEVAKIVSDRYGTTPALARAARCSMCGAAVNGLMHLVGNAEHYVLFDELRSYAKAEWSFYSFGLSIRQKARAWLVIFHPAIYCALKRVWGSYDG